MFYSKETDEWLLSTHRKIDSSRSKWGSKKSFKELFDEAVQLLGDDTLESIKSHTDRTYMFLIQNTKENRIVCTGKDNPTLFYVGTFKGENLNDFEIEEDIRALIHTPNEYPITSVDNVLELAEKTDYRETQGVILFSADGSAVKVYNKEYQEWSKLRGNEASVKFRYLQVRNTTDKERFLELYSEFKEEFSTYENKLNSMVAVLHGAYMKRYVIKEWVTLPPEMHYVLKKCHEWHVTDRTNNKVSTQKIEEVLNQQNPTTLNHIIKFMRN
jgi:hypothetical protein